MILPPAAARALGFYRYYFLDNFQPPVLISWGFLTQAIEERQLDLKQHRHPHYPSDTPTPGIGTVPAGL